MSNAGTITTLTNNGDDQRRRRHAASARAARAARACRTGHDRDADQQRRDQRRNGGGGDARYSVAAGPGGAGVSNAGTITTLTNSGTISGGNGGSG